MYAPRLRPLLVAAISCVALLAAAGSAAADQTLQISNVQVTAVTAQSATVSWTTNEPATDQVSYGLDYPVVWTKVSAAATTTHSVTLNNLAFDTPYSVKILSADSGGETARAQTSFTTPPIGKTFATTSNGVITVNGQQTFPLMVFEVCRDGFQNDLDAGINLFMGDPCGESEFGYLGGHALSVGDVQNRGYDGNGFIGWFYEDEWDAHLPPTITAAQLGPHLDPSSQTGRITFLDMTSHFYSGAAQWPGWTAQTWQQLESLPDVLGTDLYPLTSWCNPDALAADTSAQLQLAATGKPSFQWIETRAMDCGDAAKVSPTADTVRAETWLALIGQAHAIGYFPNDFTGAIKATIAAQNEQITALAPALLTPAQSVTVSPDGPVKASVRSLNGALYIILANASKKAQTFRVTAPGLGNRPITTYDRSKTLTPVLDSFSDTLPGLGTRVYIATPDGS